MKRFARFLLLFSVIACCFALVGVGIFFVATADAKLDDDKLDLAFSNIRIYDAEGELLKECSSANGETNVPISQLPSHLTNAFIAVEDKHFYTHHGLEYGRIAKAALKNILSRSFAEGASTISQQLIKNTHLSGEKTILRKLKEIKLTKQLERCYSKDQIMQLYLNSIYFGHNCFGIARASQFYFGKSATELTPSESATLAALVKSPNRYSPFKNTEKCQKRRDFVLSLMKEQGYLSSSAYENAKNTPLPTTAHDLKKEGGYLALVYEELEDVFPNFSIEDTENWRIYTAYEPKLQEKLLSISTESDYSFLIRSNQTNAVRAFVSTCGNIKRLPASTIKPLLVYAPAIELGEICSATPILDEEVDFNGYRPSNYSKTFDGYMSARYALSHSVNVPAVKILNTIGCKKATAFLEKMNMKIPQEDYSLALALGGMKDGFPLSSLVDGYATLANFGEYTPSHTILRIENANGKTIYQAKTRRTRVFSEETCEIVNDMLSTCVQEGTAKKLRPLPFPLCAKTGTGGLDGKHLDAYTIAYTAEDTVGVWLGNRDNTPIKATGGGAPADCALKILRATYDAHSPAPFPTTGKTERILLDKIDYDEHHRISVADPLSPATYTVSELFAKNKLPSNQSCRFSNPTIETPRIFVQNGAVNIELCQAEYYDYIVKREFDGEISTIYSGKYQKMITDNSAETGKTYRYFIQPIYGQNKGKAVYLPSVQLLKRQQNADTWWE